MRRLERGGLAAAAAATATGIIFIGACSTQVTGNPQVNQTELAAYTSEVAASSAAASSSRAAAVARAAGAACDAFAAANESSVDSFNAYIDASNNNAPDADAKANDAVNTLRTNARNVDQKLTRDVPPDVASSLRSYRDDTNNLADLLERRVDVDTLNDAIDQFNETKNAAREVCRAH
ncbi:hypothetical protein ACFYT3_12010 [Nocardia amikacinitolerans]|uniref:hypothetical protein n=1 Tax=Nocardia amikacinitolerans TaxID=756689 RepID=UPI0020A340F8|nr:hypothetical protein [Nocardia amikacinitolerans]MCP2291078.1 hypothetical protein [Nocardia amikacinitolerans]